MVRSPLISGIITTFNPRPKFLRRAIDSVLNQNYKQIELIVVDDGSSLPFGGVDQAFPGTSIRWISLIRNQGVGSARNIGLEAADGEYIAFLDHDDWWEPQKINSQYLAIQKYRTDWAYCGAIRHDHDGQCYTRYPSAFGDISSEILKNQIITGSVSAVLVTNSLIRSVGGFSEYSNLIEEDWDLWIRIGQISPVCFTPEALVHLGTDNTDSRSLNVHARLKRVAGLMEAHQNRYENAGLNRYIKARYLKLEGNLLQQVGDFPNSATALLKLAFLYPSMLRKRTIFDCFAKTFPTWIFHCSSHFIHLFTRKEKSRKD